MTFQNMTFNHGDPVLVFDEKGNFEARGIICGRHESREGPIYDVQPDREFSMAKRLRGIPEARLRRIGKPFLAYEGKPAPKPQHVLDEA